MAPFAVTRDPAGWVELYLDGVSRGRNLGENSRRGLTSDLRALGRERYHQQKHFSNGEPFRGSMDEFCLFGRVLAPAEVRKLAGLAR